MDTSIQSGTATKDSLGEDGRGTGGDDGKVSRQGDVRRGHKSVEESEKETWRKEKNVS